MDDAAVVVEGLRKRYGQVVALDGLSLDVAAGSLVGLLGPNGSGKTTTVSVLSTALRPDGGVARVCGRDVLTNPAAVRAAIGFAGQYAAVDANLTGRENLTLTGRLSRVPRRIAPRRAGELLERVGLVEVADRLVRTYSGGMRRRLDLAAALVHRPPVLFLDEPTTGLDPDGRATLWAMIRELVADGTTVLLTTQYLDEADALADRIVVIDRGKVVGAGTPGDLKARVGEVSIQLGFADDTTAQSAASVLAGAGFAPERTGARVQVPAVGGSGAVAKVLHALNGRVVDPNSVEIRQPTLENVFAALTRRGREIQDEARERSVA